MTSFPQFPPSPDAGDTIEGANSNITYEWREVDGHPQRGYWKARVYYYDLSELDSNYVNIIGDVMSDSGDPGYPPGHPFDPGILEEGDTFPGTDDGDSTNNMFFYGNQRLDVRPKLDNENNIEEQPVGPGGDLYTVTISGEAHFNKTIQVHTNTLVKGTEGRVTYTHQWQYIITDSVESYDASNETLLQATIPTDGSPWLDIAGETSTSLRCTPTTLNYDPMDSPEKLVFVRCLETVTDERGESYALLDVKSNTLGPFTYKLG